MTGYYEGKGLLQEAWDSFNSWAYNANVVQNYPQNTPTVYKPTDPINLWTYTGQATSNINNAANTLAAPITDILKATAKVGEGFGASLLSASITQPVIMGAFTYIAYKFAKKQRLI